MSRAILACALTAIIVGVATAGATSFMTSTQIKDGTIRDRDIHKRTISMNRLNASLQRAIEKAHPGAGSAGAKGDTGAQGAKGDTGPGPNGDNGSNGLDSDAVRVVDADHLRGFTLAPQGDNGDTTNNGTVAFATPRPHPRSAPRR